MYYPLYSITSIRLFHMICVCVKFIHIKFIKIGLHVIFISNVLRVSSPSPFLLYTTLPSFSLFKPPPLLFFLSQSYYLCLLSMWWFEWECSLSWTHIFDPQLVERFGKNWEIWPSWERCVTGSGGLKFQMSWSVLCLVVVSQSVPSWLLFQYCQCAWWWPTERPKYKHCLISWNSLIIISYQSNRKVTKIECGSRSGLGFLLLFLLLLLLYGLFVCLFGEFFIFILFWEKWKTLRLRKAVECSK